jgi:hypothetical protein
MPGVPERKVHHPNDRLADAAKSAQFAGFG